jgi:hypothetical protein
MKTEFIKYLSCFGAYVHGAALLQASKLRVQQARAGETNSLLQLFRDYPLEYLNEKNLVLALPGTQKNRWQEIFFTLLEHDLAPATNQIKNLLADMLLNACVQLLDENSQLKPELMDFFGLEKLRDTVQKKLIIYNIIYSYWMEIININLGVLAISADCNILRLEALQKIARNMLREQNNFTPFFLWQMRQFEEVFATDACAQYLAYLPADKIIGRLEIHSALGEEARL